MNFSTGISACENVKSVVERHSRGNGRQEVAGESNHPGRRHPHSASGAVQPRDEHLHLAHTVHGAQSKRVRVLGVPRGGEGAEPPPRAVVVSVDVTRLWAGPHKLVRYSDRVVQRDGDEELSVGGHLGCGDGFGVLAQGVERQPLAAAAAAACAPPHVVQGDAAPG